MWNGVFNYNMWNVVVITWYCDTELLSKVVEWPSPNCTFKVDLIILEAIIHTSHL